MADSTEKTIYAKVPTDVSAALRSMAELMSRSQAQLLGDFIKFFALEFENGKKRAAEKGLKRRDADLETKKYLETLLVDQSQISLLKTRDREIASVLSKSAWGEHSWQRHWHAWTIEAYAWVREASKGDDLLEMRQLSDFRLGSCWTRLALTMRKEALGEFVETGELGDLLEGYDSAIGAAARAATHFASINKSDALPDNPVGYYNEACALSLTCQYSVERAVLGGDRHKAVELAAKLTANIRATDQVEGEEPERKEVDYVYPEEWERLEPSFVAGIDAVAERALNLLRKFPGPATPGRERFPSQARWLVGLAHSDSDLYFLHKDPRYAKKFESWKYDWPSSTSGRRVYQGLAAFVDQDINTGARSLIDQVAGTSLASR